MNTFQLKMKIDTLIYIFGDNITVSPYLSNKLLFLMSKLALESYLEWAESNIKSYREDKPFSKEELAAYDGSNGKPRYAAISGIVYDISNIPSWTGGNHFGLTAGKDLTSDFINCHPNSDILSGLKKIGILK